MTRPEEVEVPVPFPLLEVAVLVVLHCSQVKLLGVYLSELRPLDSCKFAVRRRLGPRVVSRIYNDDTVINIKIVCFYQRGYQP